MRASQVRLREVAVVEADSVADGLQHRPVSDALAIREAAATRHQSRSETSCDKLHDEPGLADAGRAEHREELTRAVADRLLERIAQPPPFTFGGPTIGESNRPAATSSTGDLEKASVFANCLGTNCGANEPLVRRSMSSSPIFAACWRRIAEETGWPVATGWPMSPPTTTSPVPMPTRSSSRDPQLSSNSAPS